MKKLIALTLKQRLYIALLSHTAELCSDGITTGLHTAVP